MTAAKYFKQGAAATFASFFGQSKRLQLLTPFLPQITTLHQKLKRPLNILDIGAGTGMHAAHLAHIGHKVTAVDPVEEMLLEGKKLYPHTNLNFVVDSLPDLSKLGNNKYDVIYSIAAWQYIPPNERQNALERVAQLLSPGGVLGILWPVPMSREFQYPLSDEDMKQSIDILNDKTLEANAIQISIGQPIPDPDGRYGFTETSKAVFFHSFLAQRPENLLELTTHLGVIKSKL